ncbi:MAG: hypothetical protein ACT4OE_06025 [Sphingosinicella sp.]
MQSPVAHESFLRYRNFRWLKIALVAAIASLLIYALVDVTPRHNGGSWLGYLLGTIGLGLIVWLSLLGIRKRAITPGRWSLKAWTSAHVWLGLALVVIATLHSGFQLGWNVHTLAWALMMLVILSGAYGAFAYALLPRALSDARAEMTSGEMLDALAAIDREIAASALSLSDADSALVARALAAEPLGGPLARLFGRYRRDPSARTAAILATRPFSEANARVMELFGRRQAALTRLRGHARRRAQLESWLYLHVPLTVALIAALAAHVISVFFYW